MGCCPSDIPELEEEDYDIDKKYEQGKIMSKESQIITTDEDNFENEADDNPKKIKEKKRVTID
jgi:hypothetical protein